VIAILLLAAAASAASAPRPLETIEVDRAEIRLGDLAAIDGFAALSASPDRARAVAALPSGRSRFVTTRAALAELVRRRFGPIMPAVTGGEGQVLIRRAVMDRGESVCFAAAGPLAAGAVVARADLAPAPCEAERRAADLRFDRTDGSVRAARPIEAGTYLGRVALPAQADVASGDELTLVSAVGPVRISRPVVALQPGARGRRLFVRDRDGAVFAVPLDETEGQGR
jgi:hypothetical protein